MTRIITLCSGLARAGKTQLGINLACEMVRRGRRAALFTQDGSQTTIDDLLAMPGVLSLQRRSTDHGDALLRRAYLGVDVLDSGISLSGWSEASAVAVDGIISDMDTRDGCDDLLIDTSGMDPHTLLACCSAAPMVILTITPEVQSCPETFALIRILKLNGFRGEFCLVINQAAQAADANDLYAAFNCSTRKYLGLEIPLLGVILRDVHVQRAERAKQAFTIIYPDAEVSSRLVAIADAIDEFSKRKNLDEKSIKAYWNDFRERLALPVSLPGGVQLGLAGYDRETPQVQELRTCELANDMMLLKLDSSFSGYADALDKIPGLLHVAADEVTALRLQLAGVDTKVPQEDYRDTHDSQTLPGLTVALMRAIERVIKPSQAMQIQVDENRVQGDDPDWLQDGRYLKFIFRFQGGDEVLSCIKDFLGGVTGFLHYNVEQGEMLWEMVVADRSGGMNIIRSPGDDIRVQVWLPLQSSPEGTGKGRLKLVKPSLDAG